MPDNAPATPDVQAQAAAPAAAPDLSGLSTPAPAMTPVPAAAVPVDNSAAAVQARMAPFQANEQAAAQRAQQIAQPEPPAAPVPHARLLSMIQGLSLGLSAAATSIGTHGQEGGAKEVIQVQQAQKEAEQRQQEAQQALKNQQIQQQLMIADTNHKLAQNVLLMATLPDEIAKSHLVVTGEQQGQAITGADFAASHGGMTPDEFNKALSGNAPVTGQTGPSAFFVTNAQQQASAASKVLGANDPYVSALQQALKDPNATPKDLWTATQRVQTQLGLQEKATDAQIKAEAASAGARAKDLNDATGRLADAEKNYKANKTPETLKALDEAKLTQHAFMQAATRQKQMEQDIANGDPAIIGSAMANGLYAPSQVLSARSMSKPFYSKVIAAADDAAKKAGAPEIFDATGKGTGHYFNATKAESQYEYSKNIQTQNVMNKIRTLNEKGGDFDILRDAMTELPKMDSQTINKIFNVSGKEFGSPAATNYHMALYNLATLLANVQTGSIPTEGEIQTQLDLMKDSFSKGQLDGALRIDRRDLGARAVSMIGDNPYLKSAYPDLAKGVSEHQPGDRVTLKNGQTVVIKSINPDGTFTY